MPMTMFKHTKWIIVVVLLAVCGQSLASTSLPVHGERSSGSVPVMDHAAHAMGEHQEAEHSGHVHSGMTDHEERCKFNCECALGGCFNPAQLQSLSGFDQRLTAENKFGLPSQLAASQSVSPLYRPPIIR